MDLFDEKLDPISDKDYQERAEAVAAFLKTPDAKKGSWLDVDPEALDELITDISDRYKMSRFDGNDPQNGWESRVKNLDLTDDARILLLEMEALAKGDPTLEETAISDLRFVEHLNEDFEYIDFGDRQFINNLPQYEQNLLDFDVSPAVHNAFEDIFADRIKLIEDHEVVRAININFREAYDGDRLHYWSLEDEVKLQRFCEFHPDLAEDDDELNREIHCIQNKNRPIPNNTELIMGLHRYSEKISKPENETELDDEDFKA